MYMGGLRHLAGIPNSERLEAIYCAFNGEVKRGRNAEARFSGIPVHHLQVERI